MNRLVHLLGEECGLYLALAPIHVVGIRPLEVDHFINLESLAVLSIHAVHVAVDKRFLSGDDLDMLARERPKFDGNAKPLVDHGMNESVSGQLAEERPKHRCIKSVLVRVHIRQQLKERMRVHDLFIVVADARALAHDAM